MDKSSELMEELNNIIGTIFNHIGIAVFSIENTATEYIKLGYSKSGTIYDSQQKVNVCILSKNGFPTLELLEPIDESSPINNVLHKNGITMYHICYEVEDMNQAISQFRLQKYMPISTIKYSNVFNAKICFLYKKNIGLIELLQNI